MSKINITSFTLNTLMARLLTISREYNNKKDDLLANREMFDKWIESVVNDNFEFTPSVFPLMCAHLSLFVLGNNDNQFSKLIAA